MRFAHTNIVSENWKALVDFYIKTFNCTLVPPIRKQSGEWLDQGTGLKNAELKGAHLLLPGHGKNGPTLEIYQYNNCNDKGLPLPNRKGLGHIAFEVENVETVLKLLLKNGGSLHGKVSKRQIEGVGEITFVYTRDLEGNLIELQSWKRN